MADTTIVHLVGGVPLASNEEVFRTVCGAVGPHLERLPDGETGIRKTWIKFFQEILTGNPAIEVAPVPPFRFVQWDGKLIREIPRLRVKAGGNVEVDSLKTGYADMALDSWAVFDRLQKAGVIPAKVKFQVSLPTPLAPLFNNMMPAERAKVLPALTVHMIREVMRLVHAIPHDKLSLQWDVCQEVLAWEGYYEPGPADIKTETIDSLRQVGNAVPAAIDMGYHLCYGSPADEHLLQPKDMRVMVEMTNAIVTGVTRQIQFIHMPVPKSRTDDAYFAPLKDLRLKPGAKLYLGLVHFDDAKGDALRLAAARKYTAVDGVAAECGMARSDPASLPGMLAAHVHATTI